MALPDTLKIVRGTTLVFADQDSYNPTQNQPAQGNTDGDIDLNGSGTGIGTGGVAWQSEKLDLGSVNLDAELVVTAYLEFFSSPTAGGTVDLYCGFSDSDTAGTNNPANLSGADEVFQGYGGDTDSGTEALKQLEFIGSLVATEDTDLQVAQVGTIRPKARYMMLVVVNNTDVALCATDAIETAVAITPLQYQVQD